MDNPTLSVSVVLVSRKVNFYVVSALQFLYSKCEPFLDPIKLSNCNKMKKKKKMEKYVKNEAYDHTPPVTLDTRSTHEDLRFEITPFQNCS